MNIGFIGAGHIAMKMAKTLVELQKRPEGCDIVNYAIAARDLNRAQAFAQEWGFRKAYGSYRELAEDPDVDLVYIATPHSHHHTHVSLMLEGNKNVLCEKAFTLNAREAADLIEKARARHLFLAEAVWTRFMPLSLTVGEIVRRGDIGAPKLMDASLCYRVTHKERITNPLLGGGILLDLGIYCLNFARMYFGTDILHTTSEGVLQDFGQGPVDVSNSIILTYPDRRVANLQSNALCRCDRHGFIYGEDGYLKVDNINNPSLVEVYDIDHRVTATYSTPDNQISGYEYEILACRDALRQGLTETPYMPLDETLAIMKQMDWLRKQWGVIYPADKES